MKKSIFLVVLMFVLALAFTACQGLHEHTWAEANCETPKTCLTCDKTEGEALGHKEEILPAKEATCTETGLTEGKHCSVCNEVLVAQKVVDALGHTEVIDAAVAPTCTSTGRTEGKHCYQLRRWKNRKNQHRYRPGNGDSGYGWRKHILCAQQ